MQVKVIENLEDAMREVEKIGIYKKGIKILSKKLIYRILKIEELNPKAANILKQFMLSLGADCAISESVSRFEKKPTDVLLMGNLSQYKNLIKILKNQPFGLRELGGKINEILSNFEKKHYKIKCGKYVLDTKKTLIMGILNVSPDSFSGDGIADVDEALERAKKMVMDGADIIDVGGESTRPFSEPVPLEKELLRVLPVVERLSEEVDVPISVDTYKPEVAEMALELGACIVNDVYGLRSKGMVEVVSRYQTPVVIMHMKGKPKTMQKNPQYKDVVSEILLFLRERIDFAKKHNVENIIIDPGIGFGKTVEHNLEIIKRLREFKSLGYPILIGVSRKSFIGNILNLPVNERLEGTIASVTASVLNGADIVRVHDVKECKRACMLADKLRW